MDRSISIRPSKDIRNNYAQVAALAKEHPVAITVNGREDTVLLSHENFWKQQQYISELEERLAVYAHLAQAMDDIKLGRTQDADEVFDSLISELENLTL